MVVNLIMQAYTSHKRGGFILAVSRLLFPDLDWLYLTLRFERRFTSDICREKAACLRIFLLKFDEDVVLIYITEHVLGLEAGREIGVYSCV